jgi:hypothetical protein
MTWHPYQLNPVLSGQLYEGLVAVPDQFGGDLVFAECFNCSLTVRQNIDVSILIAPIYILTVGRGHTKETGNRNVTPIFVACNMCSALGVLTMVYNTQNYWIFRELLSAWAEHMLHDTEIAVAFRLPVSLVCPRPITWMVRWEISDGL